MMKKSHLYASQDNAMAKYLIYYYSAFLSIELHINLKQGKQYENEILIPVQFYVRFFPLYSYSSHQHYKSLIFSGTVCLV